MIKVEILKNQAGEIVGFQISDHAAKHVCNAVSMLAINTINSIEALTNTDCIYDYDGVDYINFKLDNFNNRGEKAGVLLDSLFLGLTHIKESFPTELEITVIKNNKNNKK